MTSTHTPPRGQRMPRSERRAQLLDAAQAVFVQSGYHAAAMDEIADRAGVTKPVLYQHFPGKLDLYLALLDTHCDAIILKVRTAMLATPDNKERVKGAVRAYFDFVDHESEAFRLVFESDLTNDPAVREHVDRVTRECSAMIATVIHEDTDLPDAEARLLAVSLVGMAQVSARFWLSEASGIKPLVTQGDAAALVAGLAWRGIRGYPRTDEHH